MQWIDIYLLDSAIYLSNNRAQDSTVSCDVSPKEASEPSATLSQASREENT